MKRDMDLLREILFLVEATPAGEFVEDLSSLGRDEALVAEHALLAQRAGLLEAEFSYPMGCGFRVHVARHSGKCSPTIPD